MTVGDGVFFWASVGNQTAAAVAFLSATKLGTISCALLCARWRWCRKAFDFPISKSGIVLFPHVWEEPGNISFEERSRRSS